MRIFRSVHGIVKDGNFRGIQEMFLFVALLFLIIWIVGLNLLPAAGLAIHVMLAAALASLAAHFLITRPRLS